MTKYSQDELVFTAYITLKNGQHLYARQRGKKVFCFPRREVQGKEDENA